MTGIITIIIIITFVWTNETKCVEVIGAGCSWTCSTYRRTRSLGTTCLRSPSACSEVCRSSHLDGETPKNWLSTRKKTKPPTTTTMTGKSALAPRRTSCDCTYTEPHRRTKVTDDRPAANDTGVAYNLALPRARVWRQCDVITT